MQMHKAGQARQLFVDLGIVFHSTGSEGIESCIHSIIHLRKVRVVADEVRLAYLGQSQIIPNQSLWQLGRWNIQLRQHCCTAAGARDLKDKCS